jgi:hypothetical protein
MVLRIRQNKGTAQRGGLLARASDEAHANAVAWDSCHYCTLRISGDCHVLDVEGARRWSRRGALT